ncbi:MAG: DUF3810 domain-containing protein [Angelakisella sp.]
MGIKSKKHRSATPIYRESGYARQLPELSHGEKILLGVGLALLLLSLALLAFARGNSSWVEKFYSRGFYPTVAGGLAWLTAKVRFSLAEWVVVLFVLGCLTAVGLYIWQMVYYSRFKVRVTLHFLLRVVAVAGVVLTLFITFGGLNYYRRSFAEYSGLERKPTELSQLVALCQELSDEAGVLREQLPEDSAGVSDCADSSYAMAITANRCYQSLGIQYPQYDPLLRMATVTRPKPVLFSQAMSYMQIVGVFFPYTMEANVNVHTTKYDIPNAMCHELAHIAGFMREDEANFLSYLACRAGDDLFFRYSGTMLALLHSTNALYGQNADQHALVMNGLTDGIKRDLEASRTYFARYDTAFGDFATSVNNTYLKANNQLDGVASYGRMVDLLLADYRLRHQDGNTTKK